MIQADSVIAGCRQLLTCPGPLPKRGAAMREIGLLENAWLAGREGQIVFAGSEAAFRREVEVLSGAAVVDARGLVGLPGFVDSHTHLPFAGSREDEFALRVQGLTYQQLAARGMGIRSTVRQTRAISKADLAGLCRLRLDSMLRHGTTTVEAKSGYGLNLEDEIKQLEALAEAAKGHPVDVIPTFMGAHEVPDEFRERKEAYIDLLIHEVLPTVRAKGLARFFDVFCEDGVFTLEETARLAEAAARAGFGIKIHADEFVPLGGTELAARIGAASADHLIAITESGIAALAASDTVATLLPNVYLFLMQDKRAPARHLIEAGAAVALGSDFNPGSSMTENMVFVLQLGVFLLRLTIEEAIVAATANGAFAVRAHESVGSLEIGKKMDVVLCDIPNYYFLAYHPGVNPVRHVIKNGRLVIKDGQPTYLP
ncbi:MAG: imidazolonepropionase [Candidatus Aminicenantes bacterium]|nr:imidazolonepropionase [Candidatus Aminicenantes bacterium]